MGLCRNRSSWAIFTDAVKQFGGQGVSSMQSPHQSINLNKYVPQKDVMYMWYLVRTNLYIIFCINFQIM